MKFRIREEYCPIIRKNIFYPEVRLGGFFGLLFFNWYSIFEENLFVKQPVTFCHTKEDAVKAVEQYIERGVRRVQDEAKKKAERKIHYL